MTRGVVLFRDLVYFHFLFSFLFHSQSLLQNVGDIIYYGKRSSASLYEHLSS